MGLTLATSRAFGQKTCMSNDVQLLKFVHVLMRVMLVSERTSPEHQHVIKFNALDFHTLGLLREHASVRASELADALGIVPTTASSVIARLIKKGLVQRAQSQKDRRAFDLTLTEEGARIAQAIHAQDLQNMRLFLSALEEGEQSDLLKLLGQVAGHVAALEDQHPSG